MNRLLLNIAAGLLFLLPISVGAKSVYFKSMNATIQVADSADAAKFITQNDGHADRFSQFDFNGRFKDTKPHTTADYLAYAGTQMRSWTTEETADIKSHFKAIEEFARANGLKISLPDTVVYIKSTCAEEFGAGGYTRGNGIIINGGENLSTSLTAHELFHVITRSNPTLRDKLYENIGFKKCNPINVTEALKSLNITNPDCPVISHSINIDGADMILVLHSKKPYMGGNVFEADYVAVSLMELEDVNGVKQPKMVDGLPVLYTLEQKPALFSIIGTNTPYILHPEEVCAEHFAALVTAKKVNQPSYLDAMKDDMK